MCVLSHFSCVQLFVTLWTVTHQAPLPMGFPRQEYWSGLPFPSSGDLPDPGIKPRLLHLLHCRCILFCLATGEVPVVVQLLSPVWLLQPHELQHTRIPCPSLCPGVCLNSCPLSQWCYPAISSSVFLLFFLFFLLPSMFPSIRVFFQWVSSSHQMAKVLEFQLQHQCFQWIFRVDFH